MHYLYLLEIPLKSFINLLLGFYSWVLFLVLGIIFIRHFVFIKFRFNEIVLLIRGLVEANKEKSIGIVSWYTETLKNYMTLGTSENRTSFVLKIKYFFVGFCLISLSGNIVNFLFDSFNRYFEQNGNKIVIFSSLQEEMNSLMSKGIFNTNSLEVFSDVYIGKINYLVGYAGLYVTICFIMSGFFFTLSLSNSFLKNTGWLFFVLGLLLFFGSSVLQLYSYVLQN